MNEDEKALRARFEAASREIKVAKAGKNSGIEMNYGLAYQALAHAGYETPLKKKYRQA